MLLEASQLAERREKARTVGFDRAALLAEANSSVYQ